jgi:hypothetical protein
MMKFSEFQKLDEDWKRALAMGAAAVGASAAVGGYVFKHPAGVALGATLGAADYVLTGNLKKDWKQKKGDWNYDKKPKAQKTLKPA